MLVGDTTRAAQEIAAEAGAAGLSASQRTDADACARYLAGKHEYLRYDQALAAGWPIATGIIEGACRHLIATASTSAARDGAWTAPKPSSPCGP